MASLPALPSTGSVFANALVVRGRYLTDINYSYGVGSSNPLVSGPDVVIGEVYNVLSTLIGDEPGDPSFGSNIPLYVFEPYSEALEQRAVTDVYFALKECVPHVVVDMSTTELLIDTANRVLGIVVGIKIQDELFTVELNLAGS